MDTYFLAVFMALISLLGFSGCNKNEYRTYPVSGHLEFADGTTPKFGSIEFYNAARKINARGKIGRDGSFTLGTYSENDGAVEGVHKIVITQPTRDHLTGQIKLEIQHDHGELVHPKYYDYRTSDLSRDVVANEENRFHLKVEKHPSESSESSKQ